MLYTVSYSRLPVANLQAWLEAHDAVLVDVRLRPYSRSQPEYNRNQLQDRLGSRRYMHVPAFGNINYKGGDIELRDPAKGLHTIKPIMRNHPIVLMCVCWNHKTCHRSTVADFIIRHTNEYQVTHLARKDVTGYEPPPQHEQLTLF